MTVSYQYEVASSTSGGFTRLLFMWRGSLYKLIYRELLLFLVAFGLLSALYRNAFTDEQKRLFEKVVIYCDTFINLIPLSFVLGFYVAYVAGRWWQQFMAIPWPDKVMHSLALYVNGNDDHGRMVRRTLMRYLNLSLILVLRSISSAVKRRFPTMDHLVEAGFMTPIELEMFQSVPNEEFNTYWIPCTWFISLVKETRKSNRISDSQGLKIIMEEFNEFRSKCGLLWSYDWISIPLVYTQVVTLATYSFFLAALVGRQYVEEAKKQLQMEIDIYLPVFTILQFFFFMGLLKVAEQLINPFGDDDEDFELNWLIDRHTKVSYLGVDTLMVRRPPLVKDKYFDSVNLTLPYTGAAVAYKKKTYRGSVHDMQVPEDQQSMFLPEILEEEENDSAQRTPKNSTPNIFSPTAGSPSAGIWRQSVGSIDSERPATTEEDSFPRSLEETRIKKILSFPRLKPLQRNLSQPGQRDKCYSTSEIPQWSSNSTIDSFCSTSGPGDNGYSFETPPETNPDDELYQQEGNITTTVPEDDVSNVKIEIPNQSSDQMENLNQPKCNTSNISLRRQSSSSSQWKGVRWKPVIDDSSGDVWSDNTSRRHSACSVSFCNHCKRSVSDQGERTLQRRYTDPSSKYSSSASLIKVVEKDTDLIKSGATCKEGCSIHNHIERGQSTANSLPNISVIPPIETITKPEPSQEENK